MSASLASSLGFGKIASTDTIREVLRTQISSTVSPSLHRSSFESAGGSASEDWKETVQVLSEGVLAVIQRAISKGSDLLLEGVHYVPNKEVIDLWREAGGVATGVVLYVSSGGMIHQERDDSSIIISVHKSHKYAHFSL